MELCRALKRRAEPGSGVRSPVPRKTRRFRPGHGLALSQGLGHLRLGRVGVDEGADGCAGHEADAVDEERGHGFEHGHER